MRIPCRLCALHSLHDNTQCCFTQHWHAAHHVQVETRITCPLSAMQTFWYRRLLLKDSKMLAAIEAEHQSVEVRELERRSGASAPPQRKF